MTSTAYHAVSRRLMLTAHQRDALTVICQANPDGSDADLDQVMERIARKTTKNSFQFLVRSFVENGWVEKVGLQQRRGRLRVCLRATKAGRDMVGYSSAASVIAEPEGSVLGE